MNLHEGDSLPQAGMSSAQLLIAYLEQLGIDTIFASHEPLLDAVYAAAAKSTARGGLRLVAVADAHCAVLMACGYARESGKPGVCCTALGNDVSLLAAGLQHAWLNHIPLLLISTAHPLCEEKPEPCVTALEELLSEFEDCTAFNVLIRQARSVEFLFMQAMHRATRIPARPAHLCIPADLFSLPASDSVPDHDLQEFLHTESLTDNDAIERLMQMTERARRAVFVIGGDCGEAMAAIMQFAALLNRTMELGTRVIATPEGKGLVNARHPLFRGVLGLGGHALVQSELMNSAVEMIILVGVKPCELECEDLCHYVLNERLIHIDEDEECFEHSPMAKMHLHGRIVATFHHLLDWVHLHHPVAEPDYVVHFGPGDATQNLDLELDTHLTTDAGHVMRELGLVFPPSARFLVEGGIVSLWATHYLQSHDRRLGGRHVSGGGVGAPGVPSRRKQRDSWMRLAMDQTEGWAIASALGTAMGRQDDPVVCLLGSHSMLANMALLELAVQEHLSVVFFVFHDEVSVLDTEFPTLAAKSGVPTWNIARQGDLEALDIEAICHASGPCLIDVRLGAEQMPYYERYHDA
jgi:acetolactate synthase I/II/III large subunit